MNSGLLRALALATCVIATAGASAQEGDPEAGRIKSQTCMGCHGIPGYNNVYPTYHVPKLGGQWPAYIVASLKAYRDGSRDHPTMQAQAASLSDQDMADIAAWFGSLKP